MPNSTVTSGVYTINGACATPTFNPAAGTFTTSTSVTISTTTGGATIRYTTNGTTPSSTVGTVYSSAVSITATSTLQAIAYETGYSNSSRGLRGLHHPVRHPDVQPGGGHLHHLDLGHHHAPATSGASIRYTTNGTTPSSTVGTVYSSAVSITATSTLQAIAYETGLTNSAVASGVYTIQCAAPTLQSGGGHLHHLHHGDHHDDHQRGEHPLHHQRHHAEFDRRHGVQQRGEHHRHLHAAGHRL